MRVLTAQAMRVLDAAACAAVGDVELMRRAGLAIASVVITHFPLGRVIGLVGPGNNGGDALAALAELPAIHERIALLLPAGDRASDARRDAEQRARSAGVVFHPATAETIACWITPSSFFLDGLLGVGARRGMPDPIRALTRAVNQGAPGRTLAVDLPTGVDATTGFAEEDAIVARATVSVGALKLGLLLEHARPYVGELWFDDIGMDDPAFDASAPSAYMTLDENTAAAALPVRAPDADKRAAGTPLIIAGSERFPGAAVLCARAAARSGAGYVTIATPLGAAATLRAHLIEQVVMTFDEHDPERAVVELLEAGKRHGSIALGPGLGLCQNIGAIVRGILTKSDLPMVLDAGALFHLTGHLPMIRGKNIVLTPHAGEFARLSGSDTPLLRHFPKPQDPPHGPSHTSTSERLNGPDVGESAVMQRLERLRAFVQENNVVTLLKGLTTLVDDGSRVYVNTTGTAALATAGTGDVLTGMIATLLSQGKAPFEAASLAAYWHGNAGSLAALHRRIGVTAGDVIDALAQAAPQTTLQEMPTRVL